MTGNKSLSVHRQACESTLTDAGAPQDKVRQRGVDIWTPLGRSLGRRRRAEFSIRLCPNTAPNKFFFHVIIRSANLISFRAEQKLRYSRSLNRAIRAK
jgi:hypothetical protein